jgi:hypothetical protein
MAIPLAILQDGAANRNSGAPTGPTTVLAPANSLVVVAIGGVGGTINSLADSALNHYALKVRSNNHFDVELWWCANINALPIGGTFTAVTNGGGQYSLNIAAAVAGFNGGADASGLTNVNATTMTVTSSATTVANGMAFAAQNGLGGGTYTEDSNWTQLATNAELTNGLAYRQLGTIGTTSWSPSWTPSGGMDGVIATFAPTPPPQVLLPQNLVFV